MKAESADPLNTYQIATDLLASSLSADVNKAVADLSGHLVSVNVTGPVKTRVGGNVEVSMTAAAVMYVQVTEDERRSREVEGVPAAGQENRGGAISGGGRQEEESGDDERQAKVDAIIDAADAAGYVVRIENGAETENARQDVAVSGQKIQTRVQGPIPGQANRNDDVVLGVESAGSSSSLRFLFE